MKKQILKIVLGVIILPLTTMAQDHSGHMMNKDDKKMDHSTHSMMNMDDENAIKHFDVTSEFQAQLNAVYKASLKLNASFVAADVEAVKQGATDIIQDMSEIDMAQLDGDAHMTWMGYTNDLSDNLDKMSVSNNIEEQRSAFSAFNEGLYKAIKSFGVGETVYYQYCPMAKASWLNDSEEIINPYLGSKMPKCGTTKEVIDL